MKTLLSLMISCWLAGFLMGPGGPVFAEEPKKKSVNEKILEILIEKKVITKQQYDELKKQAVQEEAAQKPKAVAGYDKGFYIETAGKQSKIRFDGRFHGDFKGFPGDSPNHASFFLRRARLCASGIFYKYYDFRIEPEFGKGGAALNDGFMNIHYWPFAQLKFGQFKTPFSMEELHSDNWIDFIERSLANKMSPSRDLGVMIHGGILDDMIYYQVGIFNGYKLNQVNDPDTGKDGAARLVSAPFKKLGIKFLEGIRLGGAITSGHERLTEAQWWNSGDFKTAIETTYLAMRNDVTQDGDRTREGLELSWDLGSTTLKAEYIKTELEGLQRGNRRNDFDIKGGYIYLSHFLTGEKFGYKNGEPRRVVPIKNFTPGDPGSGWGALQIGGRLEYLKADQGLLDLGYVDATQYTNEARGYTLGVNWYPNEMIRFMLNFNHTGFDDRILVSGERIDKEDVILIRFQTVF